MRAGISRDHKRQTEAHQRQSEAIRGNPRQSEAIRGNQRHSEALRGTQRQSKAHQRDSEAHHKPSVGLSGELAFISIASISRPPTPRFLTPSVNASKVAKAEKGPHSPRRSM